MKRTLLTNVPRSARNASPNEKVPARLGRTLLPLCSFFLLATLVRADDELPKRFSFDRYQAMLDHSPFAVATALILPAATPEVFKDFYVANAAHTPEADLATIVSSSDKNVREYLSTTGPNDHGYSIANIEWSDQPGATRVTISKDGKFATLGFNQALLSAPLPAVPPPSSAAAQQRILPRINPAFHNTPQRPMPAIPALPKPTPHVRGVIPRNPAPTIHPPTE